MSRHSSPDDDFSFLPTVDDADSIDEEALWLKAKAHRQPPASAPERERMKAESEL